MPPPASPTQWASGGSFASALSRQPNDAMFTQYATEWHLLRIAAPAAWEVATGSPQVGGRATWDESAPRFTPWLAPQAGSTSATRGGREDALAVLASHDPLLLLPAHPSKRARLPALQVGICHIDTGVLATHQDLAPNIASRWRT